MIGLGPGLAILGLIIDILGALVLVVPDVPSLRGRTRQGEIEDCIHWLNSKWGLHPVKPGFGIIKEEIENLYNIEIADDIERLRIVLDSLEPTPEYKLYILPTDDIEDAYTPDKNLPWAVVAGELRKLALEEEMKYRRVGVGLLVMGFLIQIVAKFL